MRAKRLVDPAAAHDRFRGEQLGATSAGELQRDLDDLRTWGSPQSPMRPRIVGSRGGNEALANLLDALQGLGLIEDQTSD